MNEEKTMGLIFIIFGLFIILLAPLNKIAVFGTVLSIFGGILLTAGFMGTK